MFDPISIGEFSRNNCVSICAFLIPANLLGTLLSLSFILVKSSPLKLFTSVTVTTLLALILCLHVASWWIIGVIQATSFILLGLALLCISVNLWVVIQSRQEEPWLRKIVQNRITVRFLSTH
ncbi:hypothetical protein [Cyanothece sp. BG0011]|uniref:hypothetical protein n=1 Tax=Cyanothece sp. BG0011 TaxID=2082950 RepID=UPI000D1F3980|nr:hypothetical protein [Cyanothece sp. BG0011]